MAVMLVEKSVGLMADSTAEWLVEWSVVSMVDLLAVSTVGQMAAESVFDSAGSMVGM